MKARKEDVAWKIWHGEGLDYYFLNWADTELTHIKSVVPKKAWERLKVLAADYLKARNALADALEDAGLGAEED